MARFAAQPRVSCKCSALCPPLATRHSPLAARRLLAPLRRTLCQSCAVWTRMTRTRRVVAPPTRERPMGAAADRLENLGPLSAEEPHRLVELGILGPDEGVQPIDWVLVRSSPPGPPPASISSRPMWTLSPLCRPEPRLDVEDLFRWVRKASDPSGERRSDRTPPQEASREGPGCAAPSSTALPCLTRCPSCPARAAASSPSPS
jgi:hypothetical protein